VMYMFPFHIVLNLSHLCTDAELQKEVLRERKDSIRIEYKEEYRASCMAWEYRRESVTTDADDVVPYLWQNEDGEYQEI